MKELLSSKLLVYSSRLKELIKQIKILEDDTVTPPKEKASQIKIIREELNKVGMEIDKIKKEIMLIKQYGVN